MGASAAYALPFALAACDSGGQSDAVAVIDSAGIQIATVLGPVWDPGEGWTIVEEPVVQIGEVDGPEEYLLGTVSGVTRLANGDIVVGERTGGVLRRFDPDGVFLWQAGGSGEGPGEHLRLDWLAPLAGDSIVTWDRAQVRISVFDPDGGVARTFRPEAPWPLAIVSDVIGVWERNLIMTVELREEMPGTTGGRALRVVGVVRWPGVRVATVSLDDQSVQGLIDVPGVEQEIALTPTGAYVSSSYVFGKGPRFSVAAGMVATVDTEAFSIRSVSLPTGSTSRILRRDVPPVAVGDAEVDAYVDWMAWRNQTYNRMSAEEAEARKPGWRERPMASTVPVLEAIRLDAAGNLWVEPWSEHSLPGTELPSFEVYTPDGAWLGTVDGPPGFDVANGEIGEDYILGVWRDELEVEYVRLHRLEK